jgi:hypothetical protein
MSNIKKLRTGLGLDPQSADPSNPVQGQIQYADGTVRPEGLWIYDGSAWTQAGGGAGGGLDVFYTNDYETTASSGFTTGKDATFDNGGTLGGALSDETSSPLSGDTSVKYVTNASAGSSDNDWIASESISLDPKQIGNYVGASFVYTWDGSDDLIEFVIWDDTNNVKLSDSLNVLKTASNSTRFSVAALIPASCSAIKIGFQHTGASESSKTLIFDDVQLSTDPFTYANLENFSNPAPFTPTFSASFGTTTTSEGYYWQEGKFLCGYGTFISGTTTASAAIINLPSGFTIDDMYIASTNNTIVAGSCTRVQTSIAFDDTTYVLFYDGSLTNGLFLSNVGTSNTAIEKTGASTLFTSGQTGTFSFRVPVVEYSPTSEHVVTPARSNMLDWDSYTPTFGGGFGTPTNVSVFYRRVGDSVELRGSFTNGTNAASLASISLPSGLNVDTNKLGRNNTTTQTGEVVGEYWQNASAASRLGVILTAPGTDTSTIYFGDIWADSGAQHLIPTNGDNIIPTGEEVSFTAKIPIEGWTSEAQFLAAIPVQKTAYIEDRKASGTNGGDSTANTVHTRDLNTVTGDTSIVSLSSNQFTLQPGNYEIYVEAPAYVTNRNQIFLYNVTNSSYEIDGKSSFSGTNAMQGDAKLSGKLSISSATTYEIRHWVQSARTHGLGVASDNDPSNPQSSEIYTQVKITKIK